MSRVGSMPIDIPSGISVEYINDSKLLIKSAVLERVVSLYGGIVCSLVGNRLLLSIDRRETDFNKMKSIWGTYRSNINNIISGMVSAFSVDLEINGVGYKAECSGEYLTLSLGYSHNVKYKVPNGVEVKSLQPTHLLVSGIDKQRVYMVASDICRLRKYDPYKGRGVTIKGRFVLRKVLSKKK